MTNQKQPQKKNTTDEEDILTSLRNLKRHPDAGFHAAIQASNISAVTGTVGFRMCRLRRQESIKVLDLIGGTHKNRISVIAERDGVIRISVLDCQGNLSSGSYRPSKTNLSEVIAIVWDANSLSLWWMGEKVIQLTLPQKIDGKWLAITQGIDIDGDNKASYITQGARAGGMLGLGLCASNKTLELIVANLFVVGSITTESKLQEMFEVHKAELQPVIDRSERFLHFHLMVDTELANVLGVSVQPGNKYYDHPIFSMLRECSVFHQRGEFGDRDMELNSAYMLLTQLKQIRLYRPKLFDRFKLMLLSGKFSKQNYIGNRLEIAIAESLISKKVDFEFSDLNNPQGGVPDFRIFSGGVEVGLECTTTYSGKPRTSGDLLEIKVNRAIKKKVQKDYENPKHTVLLIDTTSTSYHTAGDGTERNQVLKRVVNDWEDKYSFGSYLFFHFLFVDYDDDMLGKGGYYHSYSRRDTKHASKQLKDFLDLAFPKGHLYFDVIRMPPIG